MKDTIAAMGRGWAVIALATGGQLVEIEEPTGPGFYIGLPHDPRQSPVPLTPNYPDMAEAFQELPKLRRAFPKCEVFFAGEA
jgi:hypothetical protein